MGLAYRGSEKDRGTQRLRQARDESSPVPSNHSVLFRGRRFASPCHRFVLEEEESAHGDESTLRRQLLFTTTLHVERGERGMQKHCRPSGEANSQTILSLMPWNLSCCRVVVGMAWAWAMHGCDEQSCWRYWEGPGAGRMRAAGASATSSVGRKRNGDTLDRRKQRRMAWGQHNQIKGWDRPFGREVTAPSPSSPALHLQRLPSCCKGKEKRHGAGQEVVCVW